MRANLIGGVAVIEKDGKHLLIQQSKSKPNAGQWRHPGGKFHENEDPSAGMKREIKEEVGLDIDVDSSPVLVMKSDYENGYFGFFDARITGGSIKIDKREVADAGWFSIAQIKRMNLMNATRKFYERLR